MKILCHLLPAILVSTTLFSQDNVNIKFGNISPKDFILEKSPVVDSNTNAIILTDIGSTSFIGVEDYWISYVYKKYVRIKIINEKALDIATVNIHLFGKDKDKDKLDDLKAATYNIENGEIKMSQFSKSDIFEDKLSPYASETKFTLPSVKAGCIIEYSYSITSHHSYAIPEWSFQDIQYPCLYSEYKISFPDGLPYITLRYGSDSFFLKKTTRVKNNHYNIGSVSVTSNDIISLWSMKDVPAFKSEKYINSAADYLDRLEFVPAQTNADQDLGDYKAAWGNVTNDLLQDEYFGRAIDYDKASNLSNTVDRITSHSANAEESAHQLYAYVRDNFTCVPDDGIYLGENDLYTVNKRKKGNVADINLLLTALLRQKGISADPVILSTREYGKNSPDYPLLDKMNYVICMARLGNDTVYLDATKPDLGFGKLSLDCYNGHARIISRNGASLYFSPEKIREQKNTSVIIFRDADGNLGGSVNTTVGDFGSEEMRREIKTAGQKEYLDNMKAGFLNDISVSKIAIDSLRNPESPATVHCDVKIPVSGDIIYFNPVIVSEYSKNPFEPKQRKYPVELPLPVDEIYSLNMEIPEGYTVDEIPKSARVAFNGDEGFFEYLVQKEESRIQFRTRIKLNEMIFPAEDYNSLRDFFAFVIKKYSEQIVFKRKK
jgi:hypothetical protein